MIRITLTLTNHTAHMWYDDATHEANTDEDPLTLYTPEE